jgi:hypothetical protein
MTQPASEASLLEAFREADPEDRALIVLMVAAAELGASRPRCY